MLTMCQALFNFILCKNYLFLCVNICYQVLCSLRELNISETWPWLQERYRLVTDIYTTNNTNHNEVNTNYCKFKNESLTLHGVLDETSLRTELWKAWTGREEKGGERVGRREGVWGRRFWVNTLFTVCANGEVWCAKHTW